MCTATVVTAAANADDGPGAAFAARRSGQFIARNIGDEFEIDPPWGK
jgi:hypothetical protein